VRIAVWHNLPSGGGKRALFDHVSGLRARGHEIEAWCPPTADQSYLPLKDLCTEHVVPYAGKSPRAWTPVGRLLYPVAAIEARLGAMDRHARECASQIDAGRFDVLYANPCTLFRTPFVGRHAKTPSVLYLQEPFRSLYEASPGPPWAALPPSPSPWWSPSRARTVARDVAAKHALRIQVREETASAAAFDRILVNSLFSRESVLRAYGLESRVCYLGVDTDLFRPTGEAREPFVVSVGGFASNKGPDRAVRAIATIARESRPKLVWIGNYSDRGEAESIERMAKDLGVELQIRVRATDTELVSILSRATAMVYTPRLEPFGLAPLEANACGTPVVAIAEGGVRETVQEGVNGLLAPDDDSDALGRLIERLLASREATDEMGRRARAHVEACWSVRKSIDNIERHLERVIRSSRRDE
jgi:glycosyltransferase involved in cell wall biosynthesis